jgi:1-deoxy-D-xylulose-5-phosphate synthase
MIVTSPKCMKDLPKILEWAVNSKKIVAIRYPRGGDEIDLKPIKKIELGKWETINKGNKTAIIATGKMVQKAIEANKEYKLNATIINATFIKPLDEKYLKKLIKEEYNILTIEDNVLSNGLGAQISFFLINHNFCGNFISMGFNDKFIEQGTVEELYEQEGLTIDNIKINVNKLNRV